MDSATRARRLGFSAFLLLGIVLGGALFAMLTGVHAVPPLSGDSGSQWGALGVTSVLTLGMAGLAMGIGARTAGGCTSGHGLSGMSLGSPASVIATMTFFATAVALSNVVAWLVGGPS